MGLQNLLKNQAINFESEWEKKYPATVIVKKFEPYYKNWGNPVYSGHKKLVPISYFILKINDW